MESLRQNEKAKQNIEERNKLMQRLSCEVRPDELAQSSYQSTFFAKKNSFSFMSAAAKSQSNSSSRSIMITKRSYQNKKVKLTTSSPGKEKYVPLTHLDKIKLANHIDHIM